MKFTISLVTETQVMCIDLPSSQGGATLKAIDLLIESRSQHQARPQWSPHFRLPLSGVRGLLLQLEEALAASEGRRSPYIDAPRSPQ